MRRMLRDERGNIALMTALLAVPVIGLMGAAVDFARYTSLRMEMESAVQASVLAAASLSQSGNTDTVVAEFLDQIKDSPYVDDIDFEVTRNERYLTSRQISVRASGKIDTLFLRIFDIDELSVVSEASAQQSVDNLEVALVLDVSGSMGGSKIRDLRDAASNFVDEIFDASDPDTVSMSVVPFAASVNIAPIFDDYAYDIDSANVEPDADAYNIGYDVPEGNFRFTDYNNRSTCIELYNSDFDSLDRLPAEERAEIRLSSRYADSNFCPTSRDNEVFLNSGDPDDLKDMIDDLDAEGYTAINEGALWGAFTLSPEWRGHLGGDYNDRPLPYEDSGAKVLVIMSDGDMNQGRRVKIGRYVEYETCGWRYRNGRWRNECWTESYMESDSTQWVRDNGDANDYPSQDNASAQTKRVCNAVKEEGIIVYTIGFDVTPGGNADRLLDYCATSDLHYYYVDGDVEDALSDAFNAIAASINALRITG